MLQMLLVAGSAAAVAWLLFSKKKADDDATKKEKQGEKMTTDKTDVVKPSAEENRVTAPVISSQLDTALEKLSSVDNRVAQAVTPDELAVVFDRETKPVEEIVPLASTQQIDQTPAAPITAEAPPIVAAPTEIIPSLLEPQDDQQIQPEVPIVPDQATPPVPIQEIPSAAPQLDFALPEHIDEVPVEMASPAPGILVPPVLAAQVLETAPLPPVNIEAPPTEMIPSLLAPQDDQQIQPEVPIASLPDQATPPVPIQEIPSAAPQLDLALPENIDEVPVEMASPAAAILVPQVLATPELELIIPVELTSPAPPPSVSEVLPPVAVLPVLSTAPASNEVPHSSVAATVDSTPVSQQHQPQDEKEDSQDALSDHLIIPKATVDEEQTVEQSPSSAASALPPASPAAASPEKDVMTALEIDSDMVPEPQVATAREAPTTPISTAKAVTDAEAVVSPSQRM